MKRERSSKTADQMALSRAIESAKPEGQRICFDRYAKGFLSGKYSVLIQTKVTRALVIWMMERLFLGHNYYVVSRTRYIDDALAKCLADGIEQLVILGAGFDSRPYRFECLKKIKVYEVDHPATQSIKKARVERIFGALPGHVIYVDVDFNHEKLDSKLLRSGYKKDLKTFFIWEGTTPYIGLQSVDETLAFISANSGTGSSIIFDYILKSVVDGTCEFEGAMNEFRKMARTNEPLILGFEQGKIGSFLSGRGFDNIKDVGAEYFEEMYFCDKHPERRIKPWWRIVSATVRR